MKNTDEFSAIHATNAYMLGQEFVACEFENDRVLTFTDTYRDRIGQIGIVEYLNPAYDFEYTCIEFSDGDKLHWPTKLVKKQIDYKFTDSYLKELFQKIINLIIENDRYFNQRKSF
jgi:hypothetical protein